jgi:hypothetical protein
MAAHCLDLHQCIICICDRAEGTQEQSAQRKKLIVVEHCIATLAAFSARNGGAVPSW